MLARSAGAKVSSLPDRDPTPHPPAFEVAPPRGSRLGRLRQLARDRRSVWVAAALVALIGTLGSLFGAHSVARTDAEKKRLAFHLTTDEIASTLTLAIQHEEDLVVSAARSCPRTPTHRLPASTGGRNRCTRCSATPSCRTSAS